MLLAKLSRIAAALSTVFIIVSTKAYAACDDFSPGGGVNCAQGNSSTNLIGPKGGITNLINTMVIIAGIISVIMIIVGGMRYALSQGDEKTVQGAKNTILYAVIGLVIAILAFAIVNFVLTGADTGTPAGI